MKNIKKIFLFLVVMLMITTSVFANTDSGLEDNFNLYCIGKNDSGNNCYIDVSTLTYDSNKKEAMFKYIIDSPKYNHFMVWNYTISYSKNWCQVDSPYIFEYGSKYGIDKGKRASAVEREPIKPGSFDEHIKTIVTNLIK